MLSTLFPFFFTTGHSCLVPVAVTNINDAAPGSEHLRTLYVFVEIAIDADHLVRCISTNFGATLSQPLTVMGTIQFGSALHTVAGRLSQMGFTDVLVPQAKPLSPGETLGCTSPRLFEEATLAHGKEDRGGGKCDPGCGDCSETKNNDAVRTDLKPRSGVLVFVADGRFHLEAAMIHNPQLLAYRYDPYSKVNNYLRIPPSCSASLYFRYVVRTLAGVESRTVRHRGELIPMPSPARVAFNSNFLSPQRLGDEACAAGSHRPRL